MSVEDENVELVEEEAELVEEGEEVAHEHAEEEGAEGEATEEEEARTAGAYNARDVNDQIFEELRLSEVISEEVQVVWRTFLSSAESREAAGEAIYAALFDAAPSLQSLFKTPRAVMAMRFMNGLSQIINGLKEPKSLKIVVETLGFQHLDLEVTVPRVVIFRDAIVDLLAVEMGARFTSKAREGFNTFLNYVGGSYIYVRVKFSERLKILNASWAIATRKNEDELYALEAAAAAEAEAAEG